MTQDSPRVRAPQVVEGRLDVGPPQLQLNLSGAAPDKRLMRVNILARHRVESRRR